jgi:hypothetical protein
MDGAVPAKGPVKAVKRGGRKTSAAGAGKDRCGTKGPAGEG